MVVAGKLLDAIEEDEGATELEEDDKAELEDGWIMTTEDDEALDAIGKLPGATEDASIDDETELATARLDDDFGLEDGLGPEEPPPPPQPDNTTDALNNNP
ncbi:MAG: hypothetical protein K0Q67_1635 [Cellvibrio sp.]|nr:hypothetical protein [Cellvibrio sp.]